MVSESAQPAILASLDDALVRLRRLWSSPRQVVTDGDGRNVEMSSVLVVEACARGAEHGEPVAVGDVAQFADVAPSTASRLVDRAVRADLVRRTATGGDARRIALELTDAGRELRARSLDARMGWLGTVVNDWSAQDLTALAGLLGRFADSLDEVGPPIHRPAS